MAPRLRVWDQPARLGKLWDPNRMSEAEEQDDSSVDETVLKKPYAPPVLVEWGTLRDITQSVGWSGRSDGGKGKQARRTRW